MRNIKKKITAAVLAVIILIAVFITALWYNNFNKNDLLNISSDDNYIKFINVGNADCILIKSGKSAALIDTGDIYDNGENVVKNLKSCNISEIDYVFITHPHMDHIGGSAAIIDNFKVNRFVMPALSEFRKISNSSVDIYNYIASKIEHDVIYMGNSYFVGDFKIEAVFYNTSFDDENDRSVIYKVSAFGKSLLAGGDAGLSVEDELLYRRINIKADIFKLLHHGSNTAYDILFIKKVNPKYIVASASTSKTLDENIKDIKYNLPNININITDVNGNITYYFTEDGIDCKTEY